MQEGILLEADVDKHGLEALLYVFDAALVNGTDDVAIADALNIVFFELAVLQHGNPLFQFFCVDDEAGAAAGFGRQTEEFFYFFNHDGVGWVD